MRTRVKICGMASADEARMAVEAGADAVGFNCVQPPGPRTIAESAVAGIVEGIPSGIGTFLLTSESTADAIADQLRRTRTTTVQILSPIDPAESARLAELVPRVTRVQVVHVEGRGVLDMIPTYSRHVHAFLLDSGRPGLAIPELGGTGRKHDWGISAAFVDASRLPVYLAGGLSAANVAEAIREVKPFGVDLSSGVRTEGRLDQGKLTAFMLAVRKADEARPALA